MRTRFSKGDGLSPLIPTTLYGPARRQLTPGAAGRSTRHHIALTFDDGPDPRTTPYFLDLLASHEVRATFFLLGAQARAWPDVVQAIAEGGHEIGVHGWTHRAVPGVGAAELAADLVRTRDLLEDLGDGAVVQWYRPPYGVATLSSNRAAHAAGLRSVLWTAWGRDWSARATPENIVGCVERTLRPGGTVLLHDTDLHATPGSWSRTLEATGRLLARWHAQGVPVGPVGEHGLRPR